VTAVLAAITLVYVLFPDRKLEAPATPVPVANRDLLWANTMLRLCEDPDVVLDDVIAEAGAERIVDKGESGLGTQRLLLCALPSGAVLWLRARRRLCDT